MIVLLFFMGIVFNDCFEGKYTAMIVLLFFMGIV